jgi:hypothetical protein
MMSEAAHRLLALIDEPDPYAYHPEEVRSLQLQAIRDRVEERRAQISILDRRLRDLAVENVTSFADVVPLLFSHTTYKSYPESFITRGRWDRLLQWYATLAVGGVDDVDLSAVTDIDTWLGALWDAGRYTYASSGTSGKCSFLPALEADRDNVRRIFPVHLYWPRSVPQERKLRWYQFMPSAGYYRGIDTYRLAGEVLADPQEVRYLGQGPMLVSDVTKVAAIRKAMAQGTATPGQIVAMEAEVAEREKQMAESMHAIVTDVAAHLQEPMAMVGLASQQWAFIHAAREAGVPDGSFHPDTFYTAGGGTKGTSLPGDYREQIAVFYGDVMHPTSYGMSEMTLTYPRCEAGRYHQNPWCVILVLDETGERLLNSDRGSVQGRAAFFDVALEGRWGGIISGDRVTVNFDRCACGRPGPTVFAEIARYSELVGNDDKLSCSGTMEAYIRGTVSE